MSISKEFIVHLKGKDYPLWQGVLDAATKAGLRSLRTTNVPPLTPRQREVVMLIARGAADKEIGQALGIATATAQRHVSNVLRRLDVPNRAAAVGAVSGSLALKLVAALKL